MRPLDRAAQRRLPLARVASSVGEQIERLALRAREAARHVLEPEQGHAPRREFERERDSVEPSHERGEAGRVL
ncbi:MAG: hypothetical protein J0L92_38380, partial [Deltaproteobacteria bacterium]|nr:hypothetical protein [Deltaproteobacteria bacterium]